MKAVALFCLAFRASAVPAATFPAHVTRRHDGDTCTTNEEIRIRLAGIDAPEIDQPHCTRTRDMLFAMGGGQDVDIEPRGTSYARLVGLIRVGGVDIHEAMVRAGATCDYPQYAHDPIISVLQAQARAGRSGLWAEPSAIPPWTWRRSRWR